MKKILIIVLFNLTICNVVLAESYYFKKCLLNKTVSADYLIDLENKIINVAFKSTDGKIQKVKDGIESIEKDKIISKKIKSAKSEDSYFIYYLDAKTQSVIKKPTIEIRKKKEYKKGQIVKIINLQKNISYNNTIGTVVEYDEKRNKYKVLLEENGLLTKISDKYLQHISITF